VKPQKKDHLVTVHHCLPLGLEQVDENSSPYVNVQNNSLEVNTPHHKQNQQQD
jgi:hypothetical protein